VLSPLVFVFFPAAEAYTPGEDATHHAFGLIVMVTGAIAFAKAYERHRQRFVLAMLVLGMVVLALGTYSHTFIHDEWVSLVLVMSGSMTLLIAHYLNHTFCRLCSTCQH
jgi:predicted tellurium resistance membrane protein TerC